MDVSFLFSADELFTLMSLAPGRSEAGRRFADEALSGAGICDLSGLAGKKLARKAGDELEVLPVVRMIADALARADAIGRCGEVWEVSSEWVSLRCEMYAFRGGHWKITPVKFF